MKSRINKSGQGGQSNIEYILIISIVICALIFIITQFGDTIMGLFTSQSDKVADADLELDSALSGDTPDAQPAASAESGAKPPPPKVSKPIVEVEELPAPSMLSKYLPWVLLILVFFLMMAIMVIKIKQRKMLRQLKDLGEGGQAMTETALTLPVVLFFVFSIMQLGLLYHARYMVHLASFYAARSAIVWAPSDEGEGKNKIKISSDDPKLERILDSARIPCVPISSQFQSLISGVDVTGIPQTGVDIFDNFVDDVSGTASDFLDMQGLFESLLSSLDVIFGNSVFTTFISKYMYAYACTSVELMQEGTLTPYAVGDTAEFTENGPITVRVNFYYKLNMPLINAFLGDKIFPGSIGDIGAGDIFSGGSVWPVSLKGWYFKIRCTTTLDNEGFLGIE